MTSRRRCSRAGQASASRRCRRQTERQWRQPRRRASRRIGDAPGQMRGRSRLTPHEHHRCPLRDMPPRLVLDPIRGRVLTHAHVGTVAEDDVERLEGATVREADQVASARVGERVAVRNARPGDDVPPRARDVRHVRCVVADAPRPAARAPQRLALLRGGVVEEHAIASASDRERDCVGNAVDGCRNRGGRSKVATVSPRPIGQRIRGSDTRWRADLVCFG